MPDTGATVGSVNESLPRFGELFSELRPLDWRRANRIRKQLQAEAGDSLKRGRKTLRLAGDPGLGAL